MVLGTQSATSNLPYQISLQVKNKYCSLNIIKYLKMLALKIERDSTFFPETNQLR